MNNLLQTDNTSLGSAPNIQMELQQETCPCCNSFLHGKFFFSFFFFVKDYLIVSIIIPNLSPGYSCAVYILGHLALSTGPSRDAEREETATKKGSRSRSLKISHSIPSFIRTHILQFCVWICRKRSWCWESRGETSEAADSSNLR